MLLYGTLSGPQIVYSNVKILASAQCNAVRLYCLALQERLSKLQKIVYMNVTETIFYFPCFSLHIAIW